MLTTTEKIILGIILAAITAPAWLYACAAMADNAARDSDPIYSGFCPDSPDCEADYTLYTSAPTICND